MRLTVELEPRPGQLEDLRRLVADWAGAVQVDGWDLALITTELVTNALAVSPPEEPVQLLLDESDGEVVVSVRDRGAGLARSSFDLPPASSVRGRGLAIVDEVADSLTVERVDDTTLVTARIAPSRAR